MALLTRLAERALVLVVLAVASNTVRRCGHLLDILGGVAGVTLQSLVCASERKSGLTAMIEPPARPSIRVVTLRAFGCKATLVIRILVATLAGARRFLEVLAQVAFLAWHYGVLADQREAGHVMIECDFRTPPGFLVTALAFRAE